MRSYRREKVNKKEPSEAKGEDTNHNEVNVNSDDGVNVSRDIDINESSEVDLSRRESVSNDVDLSNNISSDR